METAPCPLVCFLSTEHSPPNILHNLHMYNVHYRRSQCHPTPGKPHGRRSLVGCSPWGRKELDTTKQLHFDFSLSRIGEGNGNPLQCSCLKNPRDGGAHWAAICGVALNRTCLKWLSSSSNVHYSFSLLTRMSTLWGQRNVRPWLSPKHLEQWLVIY